MSNPLVSFRYANGPSLPQRPPPRPIASPSTPLARASYVQGSDPAALAELSTSAQPDTILAWHRLCVEQKGEGSKLQTSVGRPRVAQEIEDLVVRMARENRSWGYDRIVGTLANLGYTISDQTVGNILKRHSIPPAPECKTTTTWKEFVRTHVDSSLALTDRIHHQLQRAPTLHDQLLRINRPSV
jgi:hypothetical protein